MFSLSAMSSTELSSLKDNLKTERAKIEFLEAVDRFLKAHPLDGGADSDSVYVVGRLLSREKVWDEIPAHLFISHLPDIPIRSLNVFLRSAQEYLLEVKKHVYLVGDERPRVHAGGEMSIHSRAEHNYLNALNLVIMSDAAHSAGLRAWTDGLKSTSYSLPKVVSNPSDRLAVKGTIFVHSLGGLFGSRMRGGILDITQEPPHIAASRKKPHPVKQK